VTSINFVRVIRQTVIPLDEFINPFSKYLNSTENYYLQSMSAARSNLVPGYYLNSDN